MVRAAGDCSADGGRNRKLERAMETTDKEAVASVAGLERRVARAERRAAVAMGIAVAAVMAAVFASAARPGLSEPREAVLRAPCRVVDARGKALLAVEGGEVVVSAPLVLRGPTGRDAASLVARPQGGVLCVNDRSGEPIACLGPSDLPGWGPRVVFFSKPGIESLHLSGGRQGGKVAVYDGEQPAAPAGELSSRQGAGAQVLRGKDQQVLFAKP
jgi:hypothetical protein